MYKAFPESNFLFVCPPSMKILRERLTKRGTEKEEQINTRMKNAIGELSEMLTLSNMIQFRILNDDLDLANKEFAQVVEALYEKELGLA